MAKERPIVERSTPNVGSDAPLGMAIVAPCTGCQNNIEAPRASERPSNRRTLAEGAPWPCPKQVFYSQRDAAKATGDGSRNYNHPVFDQKLKAVNPVWPGSQLKSQNGEEYNQRYAYIFVAFFSDNDKSHSGAFQKTGRGGLNIDTSKVRCQGPFLLASTERQWNFMGSIDQGETVLAFNAYYFIDGVEFRGYALEAATWQVANGYSRKIDSNLGRTLTGASRHS